MDNGWLTKYRKNYTSQRGEDGVLEKIFEVLDIKKGWCVDVGAYGKNLSNTYYLIANGWSGVLIEANEKRLRTLAKKHQQGGRSAYCINAHVEPSGDKSLDNLLKPTPLPTNFEFLSIDIDGNDYYIWKSLTNYSPTVVIIEFNSQVKYTDYLQGLDGSSGASLSYMVKLGREKGYELIATTAFNAIFVKKEFFSKFEIKDNSIRQMWTQDPRDILPIPKVTRIAGFQPGHDVSYCILENGLPVLCEELERINRQKSNLGDGLKLFFQRYDDLDSINYFTSGNWGNRQGRAARHCKDEPSDIKMKALLAKNGGQYYEFGHHLAHAANAFYTSDFDEALIVTMDGGGNEDDSMRSAFTISRGIGTQIERLKIFPSRELDLGAIWHYGTRDVFGLSFGSGKGDQCGTVMAMATLGEAKYEYLYDDYSNNVQKLREIADSSEKEKFNVAASLQKYTEKVIKATVSKYIEGYENVCLSGGVALNCVMTPKIKSWFPHVKNVFCDPVPYDAGTSLGSARYLWHHILENPRIKNNPQNMSSYLGRSYTEEDILEAGKAFPDKIKVTRASDDTVIDKIDNQKIVSVFGGHAETGRRALGNRSILADPRNSGMKSEINDRVKHRQWFRPLAPAILEEKVSDWFINPMPSPYMSFALSFKIEKQDEVPAVVHYDGTGRLQTVSKLLNPWFHSFLTKWEARTGIPVLINTSFNDSEPIVETPMDALNCFLKTGIDYLYFFDYWLLVEKV